jgi:hypothetical protein
MSPSPVPRSDRARHLLFTSSLVLAPILILANSLMAMDIDFDDRAAVVARAAEDPGRWQLQTLLGMFGFILLVPAAIAAGRLVRRSRPVLALLSTMLIGASAIVIAGAILHEYTLAAAAGLDVEVIAEYDVAIDELGGLVVLIPMFFAGLVGLLLLAVGLWRSKATPLWVPILLAVSILASFFVGSGIIDSILQAGLLVSFFGIAWRYFRAGPELREQVLVVPEAEAVPSTVEPPDVPPDGGRHTRSEETSEQRRSEGTPPLV